MLNVAATSLAGETPIAAVYRSELQSVAPAAGMAMAQTLDWRFERGTDSVSVGDLAGRVAERWRKDAGDRVWYWRIFHSERKILEYRPADLGLAGLAQSWPRIVQLVDPKSLASLQRVALDEWVLGRRAAVYRGSDSGEEIEVWWLLRENLPARIDRRGSLGHSSLRLLRIEAASTGAFIQPEKDSTLQGYESIEFSDLGDHDQDPVLARLMRYEGMWHGRGN